LIDGTHSLLLATYCTRTDDDTSIYLVHENDRMPSKNQMVAFRSMNIPIKVYNRLQYKSFSGLYEETEKFKETFTHLILGDDNYNP